MVKVVRHLLKSLPPVHLQDWINDSKLIERIKDLL
jgi:hypothetical protein